MFDMLLNHVTPGAIAAAMAVGALLVVYDMTVGWLHNHCCSRNSGTIGDHFQHVDLNLSISALL
jgi:hypothetical protein